MRSLIVKGIETGIAAPLRSDRSWETESKVSRPESRHWRPGTESTSLVAAEPSRCKLAHSP